MPDPLSLLIVDADPTLAASLSELFGERGFATSSASSAEKALELLGRSEVDLVLTDIHLPGMSGFDLIRQARNRDPELGFIVLTTTADFEAALEAIRLGARDYLVKHVDRVDSLVSAVEKTLRRVGAERDRRDLLSQVAALQNEFLKSLVHLERENVALQEKLSGGTAAERVDYRILVADDDPLICAAVKELLGPEGFLVDLAETLEEATVRVETNTYRLVVVDKNLGAANGIDLLRLVKERDPSVDVLVMTGHGSLQSAVESLDLGASGYLLKPFEDLQDVLRKIRELHRRYVLRARASRFLDRFKARNRAFLEKYEEIRQRLGDLAPRERPNREPSEAAET